jgi:DNA-binding FrmR family transcriptional regulator
VRKSIKKAIISRLHYAGGHLNGIASMVREDADLLAILQQTRAVSSTIKSIDSLLLSTHFKDETRKALDSSTKRRLNKALRKLVELYTHA